MSDEGERFDRDRSAALASALAQRSAGLSSLYLTATKHLAEHPEPGFGVSRVSVICHCLRELMAGVLRTLLEAPEQRPSPTSGGLAQRLTAAVEKQSNLDLRADQDLIPVPRKMARIVADIAVTVNQEQGRNRRNLAALITGNARHSHPSMAEWTEAYNFFLKWAHVDQHHEKLPTDQQMLGHLAIVEQIIETRLNEFFDNLRAVEDLLQEANMQEG